MILIESTKDFAVILTARRQVAKVLPVRWSIKPNYAVCPLTLESTDSSSTTILPIQNVFAAL